MNTDRHGWRYAAVNGFRRDRAALETVTRKVQRQVLSNIANRIPVGRHARGA